MYMVSYTLNHGGNNLEDIFVLIEDQAAADHYVKHTLLPLDHLHCWAVSKVLSASEPHWVEEAA